MKKHRIEIWNVICSLIYIGITIIISKVMGSNDVIVVRNAIFTGIGLFIIYFLIKQALTLHLLDHDNEFHLIRFSISFFLSFICMMLCVFFPTQGWPILSIFLVLTLFSNATIGICASTILLLIAMLVGTISLDAFVLYGLVGIVTASVFQKLNHEFKVVAPFIISILFLIIGLVANHIFVINEKFSIQLLILPICNVFITMGLFFIILKAFARLIIFVDDDKYMEINDTEYELLVHLREVSKDDYIKAIHTAYFCYKIGTRLQFDADAIRACGYYHNIGKIEDKHSISELKLLLKEHEFPIKVGVLLEEFLDKSIPITSKEVVVLYFCDAIISAILFIKRKKPETSNYDEIIDAIFKNRLDNHLFEKSNITFAQINEMKKIFKEEKLYYDFLR